MEESFSRSPRRQKPAIPDGVLQDGDDEGNDSDYDIDNGYEDDRPEEVLRSAQTDSLAVDRATLLQTLAESQRKKTESQHELRLERADHHRTKAKFKAAAKQLERAEAALLTTSTSPAGPGSLSPLAGLTTLPFKIAQLEHQISALQAEKSDLTAEASTETVRRKQAESSLQRLQMDFNGARQVRSIYLSLSHTHTHTHVLSLTHSPR